LTADELLPVVFLLALVAAFAALLAFWALSRIAKSINKVVWIMEGGVPTFQLKEERCPKCKTDNPIGWRFCGKCGKESPYDYTCTDCGQPALEDQKFCTYCGKKFDGKA